MINLDSDFKYYKRCRLNKIKECDVFFYTNRKNRDFCCDAHRYQWHNSMKALFKRVGRIEKNQEEIIEILNTHIGFRIEANGRMFYPVKERMK